MLEDHFIIPKKTLESERLPQSLGLYLEFHALEYCEDVLDIPLYYIDHTYFTEEGLEIQLKPIHYDYISEDWYINLFRISNYTKAS